jgi:hypothetical protein
MYMKNQHGSKPAKWPGLLRSPYHGASIVKKLSLIFALLASPCFGQNWSSFLDSSRAIDWRSGVGFTIPAYTTPCPTQPTLQTGSANASANATAIQKALASCTSTQNVVNLPSGTYYVNGWNHGSQGNQVVRGAGPNSTYIYLTGTISMASSPAYWAGSSVVLPLGGANQCLWTAGYNQGSTKITLNSCPNGTGPPLNQTIFLDQANDPAPDTGGGIYICDTSTDDGTHCTNKGPGAGNNDGRTIGGVTHSQKQGVVVTGVSGSGTGPYTVTISPGVWFTNIRSSQSPGAFWPGYVRYDGLENVTLDSTGASQQDAVFMSYCYNCWVKNVRSITGGTRDHVGTYLCTNCLVRDSYFYQNQSHSSSSYGVDLELSSGMLVENNIFQQTTLPIMSGNASGSVIDYNLTVDDVWSPNSSMQSPNYGHNAGNEMNLWEGNNMNGIWVDSVTWGSSDQGTLFRNMIRGWETGRMISTFPVSLNSWSRAFNVVGNILGQPGYHNNYESYSTSTTSGVNGGATAATSIYVLGWTGINGVGGCSGPPVCDPVVRATLMRWGNYDVINGSAQWNATEASPAAVAYVNANFTSSYFSSLAHTLPASLYYSSKPSWWPSSKAWPPIGPDVSTGNVGICSGTYSGAQATSSSQCSLGTLTSAWASHVTSIPAQDCYLNTMGGPPDGSGGVLSFDASLCYNPASGPPASPTGLTATVH